MWSWKEQPLQGQQDPSVEKSDAQEVEDTAMATHSSIVSWKLLWTEEPGGLQSKGSHRVRHDKNNLAGTHAPILKI